MGHWSSAASPVFAATARVGVWCDDSVIEAACCRQHPAPAIGVCRAARLCGTAALGLQWHFGYRAFGRMAPQSGRRVLQAGWRGAA